MAVGSHCVRDLQPLACAPDSSQAERCIGQLIRAGTTFTQHTAAAAAVAATWASTGTWAGSGSGA